MDIFAIRDKMVNLATSKMTQNKKYRAMLMNSIGEGLLTIERNGILVSFSEDRKIDEITNEFSNDPGPLPEECDVEQIKADPETISVYISYEFGNGHIRKEKKSKYIPAWDSAFDYNYNEWEYNVLVCLKQLHPNYPYADISHDADLGYQAFILHISKHKKESED